MTCASAVNDAVGEIRVLIADDHPMMSTALRTYVDSTAGMSCIGEVRDGKAAVEMVGQLLPDVVVMDMHMPGTDGIQATAQIRRMFDSVSVLAVTTFSTERYVIPALRAGAGGYIVKDAEPEQIIDAIRQVHVGMAPFSPSVAHELMLSVRDDPAQVKSMLRRYPELPRIPERELQGLKLLASGRSNAEIAAQMVVSEATVKAYMGRLMQRLGVRDRVQLIIRATELGLVEPALD
ncbi:MULTISPECIES: response regulator transcription factor [Nesterenkonia]|uniref:DNA-binding NarL/FixJ family response regulator n=1 Tax=Nesterenkonia xinjiangensis TaxID=225327 RepID=A0A7Z0KAZ1_9MICC|nr:MULTISPECIES: response regulator transcription factor [Nesterenkonia]MDZ5076440.1 response regulator transcription factor [Nesterenkonia sp. HG001]NYJ78770.1 DNA-binding NarL/FixJ family response regulator [Nesterenkonia xinjiangensis]